MSDGIVKGSLQIEIDGSGLEARLLYTPGEEGEDWGRDKIFDLLSRNHITEGVQTREIEDFLKKPPSKQEPLTITAARGTPVQPAKDEEVEWKDSPIPENLQEDAEKFLADLGAPEIIQVRIEKIKKQQKVEKKQKLGFLPAKEEIVTVVEKKEIPEKIEVDPSVEATGYAEEGGKLAVVYPGEPGKPGKDIYGNPILPEKEPQVAVYPGKGVEKKKGELLATEKGLFRRGKNWIEVIPFAVHSWNVHLAGDNITCLLDFTPGNKGSSLPEVAEIIEAVKELNVDESTLLPQDDIAALITEWAGSGKEIKDYSISADEDASIRCDVTEDKMKATLFLKKGRGRGKALDLKDVGSLLRTSGIKGFKPDKVKTDVLEFYRSPNQTLEDYVLVEGTPPEAPETPELQFSVRFIDEKEREEIKKQLSPVNPAEMGIASNSEFSLESVKEMAFVVRHQPIAHFSKAKPGKPGKDVHGSEIPPEEAPKPVVHVFENIKEEEGQFIADISGLLEKGENEGEILLRVRSHRDAEIRITKTEDNMKAHISISPAEGAGKKANEEEIWKAIKENGITRGIKEDVVNTVLSRLQDGESIDYILIAEGQPPKHASKNQINFKIEFAADKNVKIKENGRADYKNVSRLTMVRKGEEIAQVDPPEEEGEDGWDISGKSISARSFQGFDIELGDNVEKKELGNGGFSIVANCDGKLVYDKKRIDVENVHMVAGDVGLKSGNIKFKGLVQIKGNVDSGFSVIAGDTIQIGGNVEAALVSSDGDIVINQGVKGAGKAVLRTKKNIKAGFVEQATLLSVNDIIIKNFCLRSVVKCNGKMSLLSDKGHFIGGAVRSKLGIEVMNLGSEKEIKTEVFFGQDYLIADQIEIEEREIQKIKDKLLTFDVFMLKMEKQGEREKLEKARKEKLKLMKLMEKRSLRLFTFREKFEEHFPSEIKVKGTLFPGVIIESHGRYYETKQKKKNITIAFNLETGQLEEKSNTEEKK